ncbi:MAG: cytidine deaminase [Bdellovibrionales bacterium]
MDKVVQDAFELACAARDRAYAPYSGFNVGAVIKFKNSDNLYCGSNVENAVNGVSVCAERSAISHGISLKGANPLEFVVVVTHEADQFVSPCGACRQVLFEFCEDADVPVYIFRKGGEHIKKTIGELLPMAYKVKIF